MTIDWTSIVATIGTSAAALAVLGFLSRSIVLHWLSKDLDRHKANLEHLAATQLAELGATLERRTREHDVTFTRLHERRVDVIAEIYGRLDKLHIAFRRWAAIMKPANASMPELQKATGQAFQDLADYYYPNAIWLDRATCDSINGIVDELNTAFTDLSLDLEPNGWPRDRNALRAAYDAVNTRVPAARTLLETRFRAILGVEGEVPAAAPNKAG